MHPAALRQSVHELIVTGETDTAIARRLELPRSTVRYMRAARDTPRAMCPRCWQPGKPVRFSDSDYAELLGLYLGDGCISQAGRVRRLRLALDVRYPRVNNEARELLRRCFPLNSIGSVAADKGATVVLSVYSSHLTCLFPQHGPGKKHERPIVLERWQERILEAAPWAFIRGCIRSDGCAFVNRTGPYEYLSYDFFNKSTDIRRLFMRACDAVGVEYRDHSTRVRINRRGSVELMRRHVGLKT